MRYPISVDYGLSIEEMIKSGSYSRAYQEITSRNFPSKDTGTKDLHVSLIRLDGRSAFIDVREGEARNGLRPATLAELLAFGSLYPGMFNGIAVVTLGSSLTQSSGGRPMLARFFPCIDGTVFGLALILMQEDLIPGYNPAGTYACFVADE
jgi:hypothetical protein